MRVFKKYWRIFWQFRKIHLMRLFEYRTEFYFWSVVAVMWSIFHLFFFDLIAQVGGPIGGWSRGEMLVLLSVFTIIDAITWSVFHHNMRHYSLMVFNGDLNNVLLKPVNTQFLLMTHHNTYNNVFRLIIGIAMLVWSVKKLNYSPSMLDILLFLTALCLALSFLYFIWFLMSTLSFYFEKLDNINEVFPAMRRAWQVPRTIYTGIFSFIFVTLIPLALITSVPTELLLGKGSWQWMTHLTVATTVTFLLSRWFFHFSLRRYVGQGN